MPTLAISANQASIQKEGEACFAMAAAIPQLQYLTGKFGPSRIFDKFSLRVYSTRP
jgi:hypothetical protein